MKRLSLLFLMINGLMLLACNNKGKNFSSNADSLTGTDSITSADSVNALKDTSQKSNLFVAKEDAQFAAEAASGGMTEVELGKLAIQNGQNKRVKNFGAMMVKNHSKANNKLMELAQAKKIILPPAPNAKDQMVINELSKKSGAEFDKAYIKDMIEDHTADVAEFENASKNSGDPDIKSFATKTLPMLKNHLEAIKTINDSMK